MTKAGTQTVIQRLTGVLDQSAVCEERLRESLDPPRGQVLNMSSFHPRLSEGGRRVRAFGAAPVVGAIS